MSVVSLLCVLVCGLSVGVNGNSSNPDVNAKSVPDKNVVVVGSKLGIDQQKRITNEELTKKVMEFFMMRGISQEQIVQLMREKPEDIKKIFEMIKESLIHNAVLAYIAKNKGYEHTPDGKNKIAEAQKNAYEQVLIMLFRDDMRRSYENVDENKIKTKFNEHVKSLPKYKQFVGNMMLIDKEQIAKKIIKSIDNRGNAAVESKFVELGNEYSQTDFRNTKGAFQIEEMNISRIWGQNVLDSMKASQEGKVFYVKFNAGQYSGKYGVFFVKNIKDAEQPKLDERMKAYIVNMMVMEDMKSQIEKKKSEIGISMYDQNGILQS